ncbi:class I SAM-dependent methyltransferase [Janthinobacterium sp. RB2R34]|uniref:class I SAM-dependent methyltransferase n=1 Tax=Janthinobacterium sp. RB2R34 TaxID=3424193 RepID=UPI003F285FC2
MGWQVTGADISPTALDIARASASTAGGAGQISFLRCDLGDAFPDGQYDLVCATFLHSPVHFDRIKVLRRASRSVASGGLLPIASHGSRLPWSWSPVDTVCQSSEYALAELEAKVVPALPRPRHKVNYPMLLQFGLARSSHFLSVFTLNCGQQQ